jgi:hypothetical protein
MDIGGYAERTIEKRKYARRLSLPKAQPKRLPINPTYRVNNKNLNILAK